MTQQNKNNTNNNSINFDTIIIGAGAAGLMCAIEAGKRGRKTLVIEHSEKPAEKIRISGGGRCNFTNINASPANFISQNPHFVRSALSRYTQHDFLDLVKSYNIKFHEKTLGQLFCDESAKLIINMLLAECEKYNVEIKISHKVEKYRQQKTDTGDDKFQLIINGQNYESHSLVIATGGPSIPKMGASSWGVDVAKHFGLNTIPFTAGLVPFTLDEHTLAKTKELSGVAVDVIASTGEGKNKVNKSRVSFTEAMLFTHRGLSGPAILQISSYWKEGSDISINFFPKLDIFEHLKTARTQNPKQEVKTQLNGLLPARLVQYLSDELNLAIKLADQSNQTLQEIAHHLHNFTFTPNGTEGLRTAEVCLGGVDTNELSSQTMEAKKVSNLYFIGETVDVTGWLGGYNFQWAWSSGWACGQYC